MSPSRRKIPVTAGTTRRAVRSLVALACTLALGGFFGTAFGDEGPDQPKSGTRAAGEGRAGANSSKTDASAAGSSSSAIEESEASLARRYRQFEITLQQMAEYLRKTEPERADLLIRAYGKSKEDRVVDQIDKISKLLKSEKFGDAIGDQDHLVSNLKSLLELLQSEDRRHQLEEAKKWYENLQKEVGKLSAREKELRKATERANKLGPLADRQHGIGDDTKSLTEKIDKQDAARNAEGKPKSPNPSPGSDKKSQKDQKGTEEGQKGSEKDAKDAKDEKNSKDEGNKGPSKGDSKSSKPGEDKHNKPSEKSPGKPNAPQQGPGQEGSPPEGQPSDQSEGDSSRPQPPRKTAGREELERALKAMQQAEEELKRLGRDKAVDREEEAIRKLAEAKEQLEKILRQLREEEQEIMLTSLEARFAKMLVMQIQIKVETELLAKTKKEAWSARHYGHARELSVREDAVADEAGKALTLLKEEGSSVAFPKGVEQVRDDMLTIKARLERNDVGELTQSIEKDVIESLEEMVSALQSEIENRKKPESRRRRQRGQQGEEGEKRLVEQLAELKMLRSLQLRVNRRTKQIGRLIRGEQATVPDLLDQLTRLAQRQAEIQEATYILASGRNQ